MVKEDISIGKLVFYSLIFYVPQIILFWFSLEIGRLTEEYFDASPLMISKIMMVFMTFGFFALIIPFIRSRENVSGIRYSILAFFILGIGITLPMAIMGVSLFIFHIPIYLGSYILLTFIYAPEVLGIERNLQLWFKHHKQLFILVIYTAIVVGYVVGFGFMYYDIWLDNPDSFSLSFEEPPGYGTYVYYSIVSFTTIGYGDVSPVSTAARLVTGFSSMLGMIINVVFISILLIFVSGAQERVLRKEEEELSTLAEEEKEELELIEEEKNPEESVKLQDKKVHHILDELRKL